MSVPYNSILAATALRINALVGVLPADLETSFIVSPLTTTQVESSIFPMTAIKYAILNAEEKLAVKVANNPDDPNRQFMANTTTALTNPSTLPSLSTNSKPIIGSWGAVRDGSNGTVCSQMPLDIVRRRAAASQVVPVYWFNIVSGRIEHTRTSVVIECCTYSRSDQLTVFNANGNILLSDALEPDYIEEALGLLVRDDEFMAQSARFATLAQEGSVGKSPAWVVPTI